MASIEMMLVCKIINDGSLKEAIEWGITEEDFLSNEAKVVFNYIYEAFTNPRTAGSLVGPLLAKQAFSILPLELVDPNIALTHLCQDVRNKRICIEIAQKASEVVKLASEGKPLEAIATMQDGANIGVRLDGGQNTDVDATVGLELVLDRYSQRESGGIPDVITWPWQYIQDRIGGIRKSDYLIYYGRPKSMKTWVFTYKIHHAVLRQPAERRVLVYTKEMITEDLYDRWASIIAGVDYNLVRLAKLAPPQRKEFFRAVEQVRDTISSGRLIMLSAKDIAGNDTVSWLRSKIDKYGPHVAFIDGLYLMTPNNKRLVKDNERVASISRDIRQMVLDTKVPVIATIQANRKAAEHDKGEMDEIAFSDAFSQDCTGAIRVINNGMKSPDNHPEPTISLVVAGSRDWNLSGWKIHGNPGISFDFIDTLSEKAIQIAKVTDTSPESKPASKPGSQRKGRPNGLSKTVPVDTAPNPVMDLLDQIPSFGKKV